jgi:hypothetical protein
MLIEIEICPQEAAQDVCEAYVFDTILVDSFFFAALTGQTARPIFTFDDSNDAVRSKQVSYGG